MQLDRSCLLDLLRNHFPPNSIVPAWNRRNRAGDVVPEASRCWKPRISHCLDGRHELAAQMARGQRTGHRVPDDVRSAPEKASDASQQRSGASEQRLGASEQNSWASDSMSRAFGKDSDASRQRSGASRQRSGAPEQNSWASDSMSGAFGKDSDASRQRSGASGQRSDASDRGSVAAFEVTKQGDRSCLLDLLPQELRPSLVTGLELARTSITPGLAEASAAPRRPSQPHRAGSALT